EEPRSRHLTARHGHGRHAPAGRRRLAGRRLHSAGGEAVTEYAAFLRAVNVGPNSVKSARLRELFEDLGLEGVETVINSGNVRYVAPRERRESLEERIETHLVEQLGRQVDTFLRTFPELRRIADE